MELDYLYIGLLVLTDFGLVEISTTDTNYCRIEMTPIDWIYNKNNNTLLNHTKISFGKPTNNWGTISHFGIFDSLHKGKLINIGDLNVCKLVFEGDFVEFDIGNLIIDLEKLKT